jgi:uncharacterized protein YbcC (UPF0753/DUF2309 family)
MIHEHLQKNIDNATKLVGKTWPLYAFVTSNPLSGYEDIPFVKAVRRVEKHMGARVFPGASLYRQAWEQKEIDENELLALLEENGMSESPEWYLRQMESQKTVMEKNVNHDLDRIMAKWLAAFLDEGLAEWEMPYKNEGFYKAWRKLAIYDGELGINSRKDLPKSGSDALVEVLSDYSEKEHISICTYHLAALPGWTGYIKYRTEANSLWHMEYPITLEDYLAVRLWIAKHIKAEMLPKADKTKILPISNLQLIWLKAWEKSWQNRLVNRLMENSMTLEASENEGPVPDAQMVLCIDTRSEAIRRHIESKGNYETYGYAGFFGIAMDYQNLSDGLIRKSCPPIVSSNYKVVEIPQKGNLEKLSK